MRAQRIDRKSGPFAGRILQVLMYGKEKIRNHVKIAHIREALKEFAKVEKGDKKYKEQGYQRKRGKF